MEGYLLCFLGMKDNKPYDGRGKSRRKEDIRLEEKLTQIPHSLSVGSTNSTATFHIGLLRNMTSLDSMSKKKQEAIILFMCFVLSLIEANIYIIQFSLKCPAPKIHHSFYPPASALLAPRFPRDLPWDPHLKDLWTASIRPQ